MEELKKYLIENIIAESKVINEIYDNLSDDLKKQYLNSYLLHYIVFIDDYNREEKEKMCIVDEIKIRRNSNVDSMISLYATLAK